MKFKLFFMILMICFLPVFAVTADDGWSVHQEASFQNQGVDEFFPYRYFDGFVTNQQIVVGYSGFNPGIHFGLSRTISPSGGSLSDLGDRTIIFLGARYEVSELFNVGLRHSYVHVNLADEWFFREDRHMTYLHGGVSLGALEPYVFISSDIPAHTPINEGYVFTGAGTSLAVPFDAVRSVLNLDASLTYSVVHYYEDPIFVFRFKVALETELGFIPVSVTPEFNVQKEVSSPNYFSWFGARISF